MTIPRCPHCGWQILSDGSCAPYCPVLPGHRQPLTMSAGPRSAPVVGADGRIHAATLRRALSGRDAAGHVVYTWTASCCCGAAQTARTKAAVRARHRTHAGESPAYRLLARAVHLRMAAAEAEAGLTAAMCSGDTRFLVTRVKEVLATLHRALTDEPPDSIDLTGS